MDDNKLGNCLRTHRKKSGLSQREVAQVIGFRDGALVSRHERSHSLPPLQHALAYEVLFRAPVAGLFAGLQATVEQTIEAELAKLEGQLQNESGKGPQAALTARKLEWLTERRNALLVS